jgi:hypothetical protein
VHYSSVCLRDKVNFLNERSTLGNLAFGFKKFSCTIPCVLWALELWIVSRLDNRRVITWPCNFKMGLSWYLGLNILLKISDLMVTISQLLRRTVLSNTHPSKRKLIYDWLFIFHFQSVLNPKALVYLVLIVLRLHLVPRVSYRVHNKQIRFASLPRLLIKGTQETSFVPKVIPVVDFVLLWTKNCCFRLVTELPRGFLVWKRRFTWEWLWNRFLWNV